MKFKTDEDRIKFLIDSGNLKLINLSPEDLDEGMFSSFIKTRRNLVSNLRDFKKSNRQTSVWKEQRFKYLQGIKRFHNSIQGKRLHRTMGRFLATRIFNLNPNNLRSRSMLRASESSLKAVSSVRSHAYIELEYTYPILEEVQLYDWLEYAIPLLNNLEMKLFEDNSYQPTDDELELLLRVVELKEVDKAYKDFYGFDLRLNETEPDSNSWNQTYFWINLIKSRLKSHL